MYNFESLLPNANPRGYWECLLHVIAIVALSIHGFQKVQLLPQSTVYAHEMAEHHDQKRQRQSEEGDRPFVHTHAHTDGHLLAPFPDLC